jgi:hypothetical protein
MSILEYKPSYHNSAKKPIENAVGRDVILVWE